jgi:hypothetical protein
VRISLFFLCLLLTAVSVPAQTTILYPGVYTTFGSYSDSRSSREVAGYLSLARKPAVITAGFGDLQLTHADWNYHQAMFSGGVLLTRSAYLAKLYYSRVKGDYSAKLYTYSYSDRANVGSAEAMYSPTRLTTFGAAYTRFDGHGYLRQTADQYTLRYDDILSARFSLSVRPNYCHISDGRKLFSVSFKGSWQPHNRWILQAGAVIGERAYYYDNDLLVLYNQNETQTTVEFVQADARLVRNYHLMAEYIHTSFEGYSIRYLVAGLRTQFTL